MTKTDSEMIGAAGEPIGHLVRLNEMTWSHPLAHSGGSRSRRCRSALALTLMLLVVAALAVGLSSGTHSAAATGRYRSPLPSAPVVRGFDLPEQRWQPGHRGIDLGAAEGAEVRAAGDGIVHHVGVIAGRPVVSIRHDDALLTTYEPVRAVVRRGQHVTRGSVIGTLESGHAGCATPCLHWGARRGSGHDAVYIDPRTLLGSVRVRLKPLDGSAR